MKVNKAVITAAGDPHRRIPLQTLVDKDGVARSVLAMLVNECVDSGVEQICVIIPSDEQDAFERALPDRRGRVCFIGQAGFPGYAGALWCASDFVGRDPFLHMVGDHVYVSSGDSRAARLVQIAEAERCAVSAVQPTHESLLSRFGVIGGAATSGNKSLYKITTVVEKPTPTQAEQQVLVSGLRSGYYLAFFGMHVFTPAVLDIIGEQIHTGGATVSAALQALALRERYLGWQVTGCRYDLGPRYGFLNAQLALALSGRDRDEVLSSLVGLIATHQGSGKDSGQSD